MRWRHIRQGGQTALSVWLAAAQGGISLFPKDAGRAAKARPAFLLKHDKSYLFPSSSFKAINLMALKLELGNRHGLKPRPTRILFAFPFSFTRPGAAFWFPHWSVGTRKSKNLACLSEIEFNKHGLITPSIMLGLECRPNPS